MKRNAEKIAKIDDGSSGVYNYEPLSEYERASLMAAPLSWGGCCHYTHGFTLGDPSVLVRSK